MGSIASISPPYIAPFRTLKPQSGSTDDSTRINAAIAAVYAAGGGVVELAAGNYPITSPIVMKPRVWLRGHGHASTTITIASASGTIDGIQIGTGTLFSGNGTFCHVSDLAVSYAGAAPKTAGAGVNVNGAYFTKLERLRLVYQYVGIEVHGITTITNISGIDINQSRSHGMWFHGEQNGGHYVRDSVLEYDELNVNVNQGFGAGIFWSQRDDVNLDNVEVLSSPILGALRIVVDAAYSESTGTGIGRFHNCKFDAGAGPGIYIDRNGKRLGHLEFIGCGAHYNKSHGLHIVDVNSLSWIGGSILSNGGAGAGQYAGVRIDGGSNILIDGAIIDRNDGKGIRLASGVSGVRIQNNRITNTDLGFGSGYTQTHGIEYGGSHTDCIVTGNDLRGNSTAATTGTAPTGVVANNLP